MRFFHLLSFLSFSFLSLFLPFTLEAKEFLPASFRAKFTQLITSVVSGKEKKSEGEMTYQYPGKIRFEIKGNNPSVYVSNGQKIWYYTPPFVQGEKGQVTIKSADKENLISKFFDSLKNGLNSNRLYKVEKKSDQRFVLNFGRDALKETGIKTATLSFRPNQTASLAGIEDLVIEYKDQRKVRLNISDLDSSIPMDVSIFTFSIPPNTNIVE